MKYQYGILRTDASPEADEHNDKLLGEKTLGIEVIKSALASRCGLGNIDPQHGGDYKSSAIEEALAFPLPPEGARLVTVRPDRDSLGAMAVFKLRAQGKKINEQLVAAIGLLDLVGGRNAVRIRPELKVYGSETTAMQVIVNDPLGAWPTMEDKVEEIGGIIAGETPRDTIAAIAILKKREAGGFAVEMHGPVAFVLAPGKYDRARAWANQRYPVAVVFDPEYPSAAGGTYARWSVIRQDGRFDRQRFEEEINAEEARARNMPAADLEKLGYSWGGPRNIVSSPHGRESMLAKETIVRLVRECAESGRVS